MRVVVLPGYTSYASRQEVKNGVPVRNICVTGKCGAPVVNQPRGKYRLRYPVWWCGGWGQLAM
jgi:hypothetical protein